MTKIRNALPQIGFEPKKLFKEKENLTFKKAVRILLENRKIILIE